MKIVFLGNPNVGKSALINRISGSKIKVGNWPGVTVEKIEATININNQVVQLIDLPGTYNLSNSDTEDQITRDVLLSKDYDLIVNVVDATNLERNLYLTLLARELQKPMILLMNFDDEVTKSGMIIDIKKLQRYLQMPIIKTSATKNVGIEQFKQYLATFNDQVFKPYNIYYDQKIDELVIAIYQLLNNSSLIEPVVGYTYLSYRLFENEYEANLEIGQEVAYEVSSLINNSSFKDVENRSSLLSQKRYHQINNVLKDVID
ncbi:MAG: FeoB small GTPase domain-containing protein, partial [Bacilli bacterium]